jgi:hypothetical protein
MAMDRAVLRTRIELLGIEPPIWRRIEVPESCSFWDLHVAIQDAMGWTDSHLQAGRTATPGSRSTVAGSLHQHGVDGHGGA